MWAVVNAAPGPRTVVNLEPRSTESDAGEHRLHVGQQSLKLQAEDF